MSKRKGDRRERKARKIFEKIGFKVENPNFSRYQNKDFFNLFDFMAVKKGDKPHFVQVKSNSASGINEFVEKCDDFIEFEHIKVEYWVYHKREGWRIIDINEDKWEVVYDGRKNNKNMGDGAIDYKSTSLEDF